MLMLTEKNHHQSWQLALQVSALGLTCAFLISPSFLSCTSETGPPTVPLTERISFATAHGTLYNCTYSPATQPTDLYIRAIEDALTIYPSNLLESLDVRLVIIGPVDCDTGVGIAGTYVGATIYISQFTGYHSFPLSAINTVHHEMSSVLLPLLTRSGFKDEWLELLPNGVSYPSNRGHETLAAYPNSVSIDPDLWKHGMLSVYSASCFEEDVNAYAEHAMMGSDWFNNATRRHDNVYKKALLLHKTYAHLGIDTAWQPHSTDSND